MKNKNLFFAVLISIFLISMVSAFSITPQILDYKISSITGDEAVIFGSKGVSINGNQICLTPQVPDKYVKEVCTTDEKTQKEICENVTYNYPSSVPVKNSLGNLIYSIGKPFGVTPNYCYTIPKYLSWIKFGLESIIIEAETSYNSTDTNITQELGFAHLSIPKYERQTGFDISPRTAYSPYSLDDDNSHAYFDGEGDYVLMDNPLEDASVINFTFGCWVKNIEPKLHSVTFRTDVDAYGMLSDSEGSFDCRIANTSGSQFATDGFDVSLGVWKNYYCVFNGTHLTSYEDGVYYDSIEVIGSVRDDSTLRIGYEGSSDRYLNGSIDKVEIWNTSLTADDISTLYSDGRKSTTKRNETNLVSQYLFDDTSDATATDSAGSNDGTFEGDATYSYDVLGLELYMPFDDNVSTTTTYDYTDNNHDSTFDSGEVYNSSGKYGGAMSFDNTYAGIELSETFFNWDSNFDFSFGLWVKRTNFTGGSSGSDVQGVIASNFNTGICLRAYSSSIIWGVRSSTDDSFVKSEDLGFNENIWNHLFFTYDGDSKEARLYLNGTKVSNFTSTLDDLDLSDAPFNLGYSVLGGSTKDFIGSIDEVMVFSKALTPTEVSNIYNNQSSRFKHSGTMLFQDLDFGTNETTNITLTNCKMPNSSFLQANLSNNGTYNPFSSCSIIDYLLGTGTKPTENLTLNFLTGANDFFTPLIIQNITFDTYFESPQITINSPSVNQTNNSVLFNITATDNKGVSACWVSLDNGTTNNTLENIAGTDYYNFTNSSVPEGNYIITFYCNDTSGNENSSQITVKIDTTPPVITILNPDEDEHEQATNVLLKIQTNELSSCIYSLDSGSNISMEGDNITHTKTISVTTGNHYVYFYCNDTLNNSNASSKRSFYYRKVTGSTGSGGSSGGVIYKGREIINLSKLEIVSPEEIYYNESFEIIIIPQNSENKPVEIDFIEIKLIDNITYQEYNLEKIQDTYLKKFKVFENNITEVNINIKVIQGSKVIVEELNLLIKEEPLLKGIERKTRNILKYYWVYFVFGIGIFLGLATIVSLIIKKK